MPLPTPTAGESQSDFMGRCMEVATEEFPRRQAIAVCMSQFRRGENALTDEEIAEAKANVEALVAESGYTAQETPVDPPPADPPKSPQTPDTTDELPEHREHGMELKGVEIFRAGTWNGDRYTEKDLDDIVDAFDKVGFRPPVKLGHAEESGAPAMGWVESIRRIGDRLVADFSDLPEKLHQAIKDRRFDAVSSEIFFNLKRNGQKFRRALKAVALLGAEIPGVAGLKPLRESFGEEFSAKARSYSLDVGDLSEDDDMADDKAKQELEAKQAELDAAMAEIAQLKEAAAAKGGEEDDPLKVKRLVEEMDALKKQVEAANERERQTRVEQKVGALRIPALRDHMRALYDLATQNAEQLVRFKLEHDEKAKDISPARVIDDLVERLNKATEKSGMFSEVARATDLRRDDEPPENPDEDVDRLIRQHMADKGVDYTAAMEAVFNDPRNAELMTAYARRETH